VPDHRPDPDHDEVLCSQARHLVVTAPPGTGKTYLSVRLAGQLAPTVPSEARILLLTFSNQARTQLEREAAHQLSSDLRRRVEITNYHRFFWHGVRAYRRALGLPMRLDIGSIRRRTEAFQCEDAELVTELSSSEGLIESIAEHAFPEFQDHRTPDPETLARSITIVEREQRAGRLVFDDLGALFWSLLQRFPVVDAAYRSRYPVVIADEHQDASALQDTVVRRLSGGRLVVFADPMQLIHQFRGASSERLSYHRAECDQALTLQIPHRWHGSPELARWLLAVRERLEGRGTPCPAPMQLRIERSPAQHGFNGAKPLVRSAVTRAFNIGAKTVAVLARNNQQVADLRSYLCRQHQYPRQIGNNDFEDARHDIEQLPLLSSPQAVALHVVDRIPSFVPTLPADQLQTLRRRILADGINMRRAGTRTAPILRALEPIYRDGPSAYFGSMAAVLAACNDMSHHLPRVEAVQALRVTAEALVDEPRDLEPALEQYSAAVLAVTLTAPQMDRGLFVMTTHQAKGKEFDAIILADATERFWPDNDDSRRLFYVAVTRASQSWTVIAPDQGGSPLLRHLIG
jgi:superfamily I DNA/RNA helicase